MFSPEKVYRSEMGSKCTNDLMKCQLMYSLKPQNCPVKYVRSQLKKYKINLRLISYSGLFPLIPFVYLQVTLWIPKLAYAFIPGRFLTGRRILQVLYDFIFHSCCHQLSAILWGFSGREATRTPILFPTAIKNSHHKNTYWITALVLWKRIQ